MKDYVLKLINKCKFKWKQNIGHFGKDNNDNIVADAEEDDNDKLEGDHWGSEDETAVAADNEDADNEETDNEDANDEEEMTAVAESSWKQTLLMTRHN